MWSYLRVDGIGNNESSLVHHRGFVGKFTFPVTPDLEEQEQMFGGGSIVNTNSATPYKCTRRYSTGLGGGLAAGAALGSNTDCSVRSVLSPPIRAIIAAVMSFSSHLNDALPHSMAFSDHFFFFPFPFRSSLLSSHKIKKHNYLGLLSYPPLLLYSAGEWSPLYLRKGFDNITAELPSLLYQY